MPAAARSGYGDWLSLRADQGGGGSAVRLPKLATCCIRVLAVSLLLAGLVAEVAPAALAAGRAGSSAPAADGLNSGRLSGAAATSDTALIEQWNGTAWKRVPSPSPGGLGTFQGVAATSATNAWAVGQTPTRAFVEHWNGTAWKQQAPSSGFPFASILWGVAATSSSNAWAVGFNGSTNKTLIEHWNGTAWNRVSSPGGAGSTLLGVAATSTSDAWAVGWYCTSSCGTTSEIDKTLTEHWNGTAWVQVPNPSPQASYLYGVTAISATNVWAVGYAKTTTGGVDVIEHWNGTAWKQVPAPSAGAYLTGVAATSATNAWAVGDNILHWNGTAWNQVLGSASTNGGFEGVAAISGTNAWAVGNGQGSPPASFAGIMHWNGTAWKQVPSPSYTNGFLYGVAATSASNAWAVGYA
jgi:hypothetical protein